MGLARMIILSLFPLFSMLPSFSQKNQTALFEKSKGKLSFPVCSVYGYNDIKCTPYSKISPPYKNITFITDSAAEVRAIYKGRVCRIFPVENDYAVVTNFGNYYITYYPLKKPGLKKGDIVVAGQPISKVGYLDSTSEINILISKDSAFINPYQWFRW